MKIATRVVVFTLGLSLLFFAWYKAHGQVVDLQKSTSPTSGSPEILVVIGAFLALLAFAPSSETLGRWMSLKRPKKPMPAHFRRRHRN